jgi:glycosyltransferase involved in cell wall biosynthesis
MNPPANTVTTGPLVGCTITHSLTLPQAIVLATAFRQFHPEAEFCILVVDRPNDPIAIANATVLGLRDLGLAPGEEWRWPMLYHKRDPIPVLKPALIQALLRRGAGRVACFEYSTVMFGTLSELELPGGDRPVVATEAIHNDFGDSGRSFIAAASGAESDLPLLSASPAMEAGVADREDKDEQSIGEDLFATIPHTVITTPGFAIGYWNLDPRCFTSSPRGYEVDGQALRSFDFRGYDPDKPHLLSRYQGLEPRVLLSEHPALAKLCDEYREKISLAAQGNIQIESVRPGFLPSGLRIDHRILGLYLDALQKWRAGETPEPPSPFGAEGEQGFMKWLNEPLGQPGTPVTRYMLAVHKEREDVKDVFPDPLGADGVAFFGWYLHFGRHELEVPDALVPADFPIDATEASRAHPDSAAGPVNVAGYFRAELGLGVAARSLLPALEAAEIPFNAISFGATVNRQDYPFVDRAAQTGAADVNIVCVNPDQLPVFAEQTGPALREGRYTIGVWFWEVEDFPNSLLGAFNYVNEVWVASDFMRQTLRKVSPKPVFKFRLPVLSPQIDPSLSRGALHLPDRFIFLFSFDLLSVLERKNPLGLIKAFSSAFSEGEGPVLVIKTINGDKRCREMEKLKYAARGRSDVILMDGYLSQVENNTLTALCDCYVSLHRSEGFGLTLAEAMALGKPVIATAYSGNLDFMTAENSYLCPARRCQVGPDRDPYPAESYWSEPDLEAATGLLRYVHEHQEEAGDRGSRAAEDIRLVHSPAMAGGIIRDRLAAIRRRRARTGPAPSIALLEDRIEELEAENARLRPNS